MQIRRATPADLSRCVQMAVRFLQETPYGQDFPPDAERLGRIVEAVLSHGIGFVVGPAFGAHLIGMLGLFVLDHPLTGQKTAEEVVWWVEPEWRGTSAGPRLLKAAEDWAQRNGVSMLKMVAPIGGTGQRLGNFFESRQYRPIEATYIRVFHARPASDAQFRGTSDGHDS